MNNNIRSLTIAASICCCYTSAHAGMFYTSCLSSSENIVKNCSAHIADIVTDKFIAKFPSGQWKIFIHSDAMAFTNGGAISYAVAGVVPKSSNDFPIKRLSAGLSRTSTNQLGAVELHNLERDAYRNAARALMDQCEVSPNCDIYIAPKRQQP